MLKLFLVTVSISCAFSQTVFPAGTNVPNVCVCGTSGQCVVAGGGAPTDGSESSAFQARIMNNGPVISSTNITSNITCSPISTGLAFGNKHIFNLTTSYAYSIYLAADSQDDCDPGLDRCCPPNGFTCGLRYPPPVNAPLASGAQVNYGDFAFQAALFTMNDVYIGSGVIIDQFHVLTAAHKVYNISGTQIKVRVGDWNLFATTEPFPALTINATFAIHPNFTVPNLKNNIAIITLSQRVPLGKYPTITNICLPNMNITNMRCFVSGWGKVDNTTTTQNILSSVDLPIVDQATCQTQLRNTTLGKTFVLDKNSFICAGGEAGKDSCTGDGGSPLSCFMGDRYYLVGLTAWGVGCGVANVPGVYVNVQSFVPWIQSFIANQTNNGAVTTKATSVPTSIASSTTTTTAVMGGAPSTTAKPTSASPATSSASSVASSVSTAVSVASSASSTPSTTNVGTPPPLPTSSSKSTNATTAASSMTSSASTTNTTINAATTSKTNSTTIRNAASTTIKNTGPLTTTKKK
ncbi:hypothetical protein PVAND_015069 [Polypedilum vanderplanki]|uniref:Peptidase S1 domain-containing protein n=1 Tax=Polypedilum vanderplanki TaxID=319348 RepID=A0A9J6BBJ1_POLVA|nr:hypothetical protein PVAND_015069 [Polypedilum vanderplanki]